MRSTILTPNGTLNHGTDRIRVARDFPLIASRQPRKADVPRKREIWNNLFPFENMKRAQEQFLLLSLEANGK